MQINTSSNRKRNILIIASAIVLLLLTIFVLEKTRITDFIKDPTYQEVKQGPTEDQLEERTQTEARQKEEFLDKNSENDDAKPAEVPTDTDTISLSLIQEGESVIVHNELHGQGYSSGTCKLTVRNGEKSTTQESQIMYQPEFSMCAGFAVPVSAVGGGSWTVTLEVTPLNGQTLSKTSTVEVRS